MGGDCFGSFARGLCGPRAGPRFRAVAFDYFVIFDANSIVPEVEKVFPGKGAEFTRVWRAKQFEYCYLRTITGRFADFSAVTEDALVYAAEAMHLDLTPETRQRLLNAYLNLKPWPDAADGLRKLKAAGVRIITISVFSGAMLRANAEHAGIADWGCTTRSSSSRFSICSNRRATSARCRL